MCHLLTVAIVLFPLRVSYFSYFLFGFFSFTCFLGSCIFFSLNVFHYLILRLIFFDFFSNWGIKELVFVKAF